MKNFRINNLKSKQDYQKLLLELLAPLRGRYSEGRGRLTLAGAGACYPQEVIELEAFARPLWGLAPFWAGGGRDELFEEIYREGLAVGANPKHPEYWGDCEDMDQRFVEMAPIAFGLLIAPGQLWEPLTETEKGNLATWLSQINDHELPKCNWYYFRILVNLALRARKCPYSRELLESDMSYMESCYEGGGWYVDGSSVQKDYYCGFAMHFYGLLYAALSADQERRGRLRERSGEFAGSFIGWFDERGAALPYGRSLTYRFAQAAFWSAALYAEVDTYDAGVVKGIINRHLRYWLSMPVFQGDGTLSIGYGYPNLTMAERYNAPGSPYWCVKLFLILSLPDEHPFWKAEEKPLPFAEPVKALYEAEMLLQRRPGEVVAYVPGVYTQNVLGHFKEKYGKFAYSSVFGFSVSHSGDILEEAAPDSMLAFVPEGEQQVYVRKRAMEYRLTDNSLWCKWSPVAGVMVETEIAPVPEGHIRRHVIVSDRAYMVYDCGFSVAQRENPGWGCRVIPLSQGGVSCKINANANTNILYKNTVIPAVRYLIEPGRTVLEDRVETWSEGGNR